MRARSLMVSHGFCEAWLRFAGLSLFLHALISLALFLAVFHLHVCIAPLSTLIGCNLRVIRGPAARPSTRFSCAGMCRLCSWHWVSLIFRGLRSEDIARIFWALPGYAVRDSLWIRFHFPFFSIRAQPLMEIHPWKASDCLICTGLVYWPVVETWLL